MKETIKQRRIELKQQKKDEILKSVKNILKTKAPAGYAVWTKGLIANKLKKDKQSVYAILKGISLHSLFREG